MQFMCLILFVTESLDLWAVVVGEMCSGQTSKSVVFVTIAHVHSYVLFLRCYTEGFCVVGTVRISRSFSNSRSSNTGNSFGGLASTGSGLGGTSSGFANGSGTGFGGGNTAMFNSGTPMFGSGGGGGSVGANFSSLQDGSGISGNQSTLLV